MRFHWEWLNQHDLWLPLCDRTARRVAAEAEGSFAGHTTPTARLVEPGATPSTKSWGDWQPATQGDARFEFENLSVTAGDELSFDSCRLVFAVPVWLGGAEDLIQHGRGINPGGQSEREH